MKKFISTELCGCFFELWTRKGCVHFYCGLRGRGMELFYLLFVFLIPLQKTTMYDVHYANIHRLFKNETELLLNIL